MNELINRVYLEWHMQCFLFIWGTVFAKNLRMSRRIGLKRKKYLLPLKHIFIESQESCFHPCPRSYRDDMFQGMLKSETRSKSFSTNESLGQKTTDQSHTWNSSTQISFSTNEHILNEEELTLTGNIRSLWLKLAT